MDIFDQLKKIDQGDTDAIKDEEFFKEFNPFMVSKWFTYTTDPKRVICANELVNPMIFRLNQDKKLIYYLTCCCSDGKEKRYSWLKRPKSPNIHVLEMISDYYEIELSDAEEAYKELTKEDLLEIMEEIVYDTDLQKKIKNAL